MLPVGYNLHSGALLDIISKILHPVGFPSLSRFGNIPLFRRHSALFVAGSSDLAYREFLLRVIQGPFDNIGGPDGVNGFFQYRPARLVYIQQHPEDAVVKLAQERTAFSQ